MYFALLFCFILLSSSHAQISMLEMNHNSKNSPPPFYEKAKTARYIAHNTDWAILGTTSTMDQIAGRPFTNIISFCDGPVSNSTGTPYFYIMSLDASMRDIIKGSMVSMTVTEAMTDYCKTSSYDPEDPRCARLTLSGKMANVTGSEKQFALDSLFSRHPEMKSWSTAHSFYPIKLIIDFIWMIDMFGQASVVSVEDYYNVHF